MVWQNGMTGRAPSGAKPAVGPGPDPGSALTRVRSWLWSWSLSWSYSLLILVYGLKIRCRADPKSTRAAIPSSMPITRPRPYMSCVTWSPTAKCLGGGATGALKGLVGK